MFRAFALRLSDQRNCGLCVCLYAENGATLWWENNDGKQEKLVEWKAVVDSAGIKTAD